MPQRRYARRWRSTIERNTAHLIDTSFFVALTFPKDKYHSIARETIRKIQGEHMVAASVIPELFHVSRIRVSYDAAMSAIALMQNPGFEIVNLTAPDRARMHDIMTQYHDAELDFADTAQMALAERLNVRRIYTFDRRDFAMFRPRHCDYLELLP